MEKPRMVEIDHDLASMQELVGGDIACTYPWKEDLVCLVQCDDAIALGYPLNRMLKDEDDNIYDVTRHLLPLRPDFRVLWEPSG